MKKEKKRRRKRENCQLNIHSFNRQENPPLIDRTNIRPPIEANWRHVTKNLSSFPVPWSESWPGLLTKARLCKLCSSVNRVRRGESIRPLSLSLSLSIIVLRALSRTWNGHFVRRYYGWKYNLLLLKMRFVFEDVQTW